MTKHQIIDTPGGERLVVVPFAEYEALVAAAEEAAEDAADVAAYDAAKAEITASGEPLLSAAASGAILARNGYLKAVRKARDMTQEEVATGAGIAQGFLSDVESGRRNASAETLAKIASVLGIPTEQFSQA